MCLAPTSASLARVGVGAAIAAPTRWKATKAGADEGAMPARVFENIRSMVAAGLAKLVEDVKT